MLRSALIRVSWCPFVVSLCMVPDQMSAITRRVRSADLRAEVPELAQGAEIGRSVTLDAGNRGGVERFALAAIPALARTHALALFSGRLLHEDTVAGGEDSFSMDDFSGMVPIRISPPNGRDAAFRPAPPTQWRRHL